jgi:O-succinylbenzoic acid--CoA ligase
MKTIPCPVRTAAEKWPDASALVGPRGSLTWGGLDRIVSAVAARLKREGVTAGSRVGEYVSDRYDAAAILPGLLRSGATACMLNTRIPVEGIKGLLARTECQVVVTDRPIDFGAGVRVLDVRDLLNPLDVEKPDAPVFPVDREATIVFTSGSTGEPKGAIHSMGNHYYSALGSGQNIALREGDRWLLSLPLYHVGGLSILFRCFFAGATVVVPDPSEPVEELLEPDRITHVSMVSTQLLRLLRSGKRAFASLKAILLGGSAIEPGLLDEAVARRLPVHTSYGLTEMASQVTTTPPGASRKQLGTSGRVLPYRNLSVAPDGEILVKGETLFKGYVGVGLPVDGNGWFHTGDLGFLDPEGYLVVTGRKDNLFISGGENIQPEEIERLLGTVEGVGRAVVVPVKDDEFGCRPVAFVEMRSEADAVPLELVEKVNARLAAVLPRYKLPVAYYPLSDSGTDLGIKVNRSILKERAESLYRSSRPKRPAVS